MIPTGHRQPTLRGFLDALLARLELEKAEGRDFIPLGATGRSSLQALERSDPRFDSLDQIERFVRRCRRCRLGSGRLQAVPGEGNQKAQIMIVGEGPGQEEDQQGRPFVGPAGQLLTKMLQGINLEREEVFIGNVIKCRPPRNRNPEPEEVQACFPLLREQIRLINPRLLVPLGAFAAQALTGSDRKISEIRGQSFSFDGRLVIPTYHPAYLLRSPEFKRPAWEDLKKIKREYERIKE